MRHGARWSIAAVILMVAGVIAIWPRSDPAPAPEPVGAAQEVDLSAARTAANLPACPTGGRAAGLTGIAARCLADGTTVDVGKALKGPVLLNVWATWCEPCKTELPLLSEYAATPGAIPVVALAVQSRESDALELLTALKVRLPNLLDERGRAKEKLHPVGLPASYLVGADGTATLIENPRVFTSVDQIRQAVAHD